MQQDAAGLMLAALVVQVAVAQAEQHLVSVVVQAELAAARPGVHRLCAAWLMLPPSVHREHLV